MKTYFNLITASILFLFANQAVANCFFEPNEGLIFANGFESGADHIFADGFEGNCTIDMPIVVAAGNTTNHVYKDVIIKLKPGLAGSAKRIHMVIHNLQRLPNDVPMAYLQVINNNGSSRWVALNNKNGVASGIVYINDKVKSYGGIGGGFHTLGMVVNVEMLKNNIDDSRLFLENENTFRFWLNKSAYSEGASAYRVTWLAVTSNTGEHLAGRNIWHGSGAAPDAAAYIADNTTANRNEGKNLWDNKTLIAKPGDGNIRAKCMDCHTKTGYDLKYFGYTNESIYKRSRFHGFSDIEAKRLTRYIRSLDTPSYGRPWNPPYQPGYVGETPLSSLPVERWAAGAGKVLKDDEDMLSYVFPDTNNNGEIDQADVDVAFQLSQVNPGSSYLGINLIDIPIHLQLPDWNRWLPRVHPVDIWPDFKNVSSDACPDDSVDPDPYGVYSYLVDNLEDEEIPHIWRLSRLFGITNQFVAEGASRSYSPSWLGGRVSARTPHNNVFRSASEDNICRLNTDKLTTLSSAPYRDEMFDEYAKRAITHWMGVKYFETYHVGGLEDKLQEIICDSTDSNYLICSAGLAGARGWASWNSSVFHHAPHMTARNAAHWEGRTNTYDPDDPYHLDADDQTLVEGDYTSAVWYHLQVILNSGNKQRSGCCGPPDWAYNYAYYYRLGINSGQAQTMIYVATLMKDWQVRDVMNGDSDTGTGRGMNMRTVEPTLAYWKTLTREGAQVPDSDIVARLDEYSPNLYRYFLNTAIKRWVQIVTHPDFPFRYSINSALNKLDIWPRGSAGWSVLDPKTYKPTERSNGRANMFNSRDSANNCWRLLPLLSDEGVDGVLLEDYKNWCKAAWPGPAGNLNDWDSRL